MAPVIDLKDGIRHRKSLHTGSQFPVESHACRVQVLIVDADRQDEMTEDDFRDFFAPFHLFPGLERSPDILQIIICWIVCYISQRHIGVKELQRLPFSYRNFTVVNITVVTGDGFRTIIDRQEGAEGTVMVRQATVQGFADGIPVRGIGNEVLAAVTGSQQEQGSGQDGKEFLHVRMSLPSKIRIFSEGL